MQNWPELPIAAWRDTYATLHLYTQVVGKVRLALVPKMNQWWNVPLYVTTRGLTTAPMPYGDRTVSIDFDFIDHALRIDDSDGRRRAIPLVARPVAEFCHLVFDDLAFIDVEVPFDPMPQECPVTVPLTKDVGHASYDPSQARAFFEVLRRVDTVFQLFRSRFRGKCSPVHFFWGSFDLAVTRFNGRRAPLRKSAIDRDAYDEEVISLGFWPGDDWTGATDALFYSYTAPEPPGLASERLSPGAASFSAQMKEFVLPYEAVRRSADPAKEILQFAESTYQAGARRAGWDIAALAYP